MQYRFAVTFGTLGIIDGNSEIGPNVKSEIGIWFYIDRSKAVANSIFKNGYPSHVCNVSLITNYL